MNRALKIVDMLLEDEEQMDLPMRVPPNEPEFSPEEIVAGAVDARILTTYNVVTPESAEQGDYAESGWYDEEGDSVVPDQYDVEEGLTVVDKAVEWLRKHNVAEASSSHFHQGVWYTSCPDVDYGTGAETTYNYHLQGFTPEQEEEIFKRIHARDCPRQ